MTTPDCNSINWGQFITWLLVIVGWIIVNWQNNRREDRKEIRAVLNEIIKSIDSLEDKAFQYHTSEIDDRSLSSNITHDLNNLSSKILSSKLLESANAKTFYEFKIAITLNNFESSKRIKIDKNDQIINEIRETKNILLNALENSFNEKYHGRIL